VPAAANACTSGKATAVSVGGKTYATQVLTLVAGSGAQVTKPKTTVKARVVGALKNGTLFWNSSNPSVGPNGDFGYTYDATPRQLIVGFDVGSYLMKKGETRSICIPPQEGYGPEAKPGIPAGSTLLFTLQCDDITQPKDAASVSSEQQAFDGAPLLKQTTQCILEYRVDASSARQDQQPQQPHRHRYTP